MSDEKSQNYEIPPRSSFGMTKPLDFEFKKLNYSNLIIELKLIGFKLNQIKAPHHARRMMCKDKIIF